MESKVILREIQDKNHSEFKRLFNCLYCELVTYANEYLFDKGSSEDVVQDVFIYLWEKSYKISLRTSLKAYLYTMVRNRCLNILKGVKITDTSKVLDTLVAFDTNYTPDWSNEDEKQILYRQVMNIIEKLPTKMQAIVKLRFIDNYKYTEIADELGVSVNTVKTQLKRAKMKFGKLIISIAWLFSIFQ